jgi:8-oxo-dGTP pyrophosphatase MutT (NUDIX family)
LIGKCYSKPMRIDRDTIRLAETTDLDREAFRALARARLNASAPQTHANHKTGRPVAPDDFDMEPELFEIFAAMPPPREAAVLVPVIAREQLTVLFTRRTDKLSAHAGQISFPGGTIDVTDPTPADAALREIEEEIGLSRSHIELLGHLDAFRTGTGFRITPVVALVEPGHTLTLNTAEVAETFEVPFSFLMNPANHQSQTREYKGRDHHFYAMPYGPHYIWGATAGIVKNMHERFFGQTPLP